MTTPLQRELAERITRLVRDEGLVAGTRLNEAQLAERLGVSRTPVRSALAHLEAQGFVVRHKHRGAELVRLPPLPRKAAAARAAEADDDDLLRIVRDRREGRLATDVSEQELMQLYRLGRPALMRVLERLAELGVVERKPGYGWRFATDVWDARARHESYRFRMTIEPAALREPGFSLPQGWIESMQAQHRAFLDAAWTRRSSIAFFEMNAAFHEGLAAASGNRYFLAAMQRQNRLRRLTNYDWRYGRARVEVNCREHLEMLDRIAAGDLEIAALLMHRHLDTASRVRADDRAADAAFPGDEVQGRVA